MFVCPDIASIEGYGRSLGLSDCAMQLTMIIVQMYLKKTYNQQRYGSGKFLIAAFIYIGALLAGEVKTQAEVANACKSNEGTLRKWCRDILKNLDIKDFADIGHRSVRVALRNSCLLHRHKNDHKQLQECPLCRSLFTARNGSEDSGYITCYNCGAKEDVVCNI